MQFHVRLMFLKPLNDSNVYICLSKLSIGKEQKPFLHLQSVGFGKGCTLTASIFARR